MSPVGKATRTLKIRPMMVPTRRFSFACSGWMPLRVQYAPMAATTKEPVTTAAIMLCAYWPRAHGFSRKAQKLVSCSVPSAATM